MKKRIGILGGTFNPPHYGHLLLAQEAMRLLKLDKVIFIPAYIPPHKEIDKNNAYLRYRMVKLACQGNPKFEVSDTEILRKSVSYSVETLRELDKKYGKEAELFFVAGSDSLGGLGSWKNIDEVLKLAHFVIAARPGFPAAKPKRGIRYIKMPVVDISSSDIRKRVRSSAPFRYLVPENVRKFITAHKMYR